MTSALPTPNSNPDHKLDCPPNPIPLTQWRAVGNVWPTENSWYNMLRPENLRDELIEAGVASVINGRWLIFPDKWRQYCAKNHRPRST